MSSKQETNGAMKNNKTTLVPKLRFPEFGKTSLRCVQLGDVTEEGRSRNGNKHPITSVMGVTKSDGIVPMEAQLIAADIGRYKRVKSGWFAYNPMRLNIGSIAHWKGENEILVSPDYVVFKCIENNELGMIPDYLDHYRQTKAWENFVTKGGDGSVRVRIYYKDISRIELALPALSEQQKIADCLNFLDELIAAQSRKINALKAHKKGLMLQIFPQEGKALPNLSLSKNREPWIENNLNNLCITISSGRDKLAPEGTFTLYGSTRIIGKTTNPSFHGERILVARVGANAGQLTKAKGIFGVTDNTIVINLKPSINYDFICYYLESINVNKLIFGSGQPLITGSILKKLKVLVPPSVEQQNIATCLSSLDDLVSAHSRKLEVMKAHKKGLTQQLFPPPLENNA